MADENHRWKEAAKEKLIVAYQGEASAPKQNRPKNVVARRIGGEAKSRKCGVPMMATASRLRSAAAVYNQHRN